MRSKALLRSFAEKINKLADRGVLTWDWFLNGSWNRNSRLHAIMFGTLVRSVPPPYIPMVEVKWSGRFKPDLCVLDERCKQEIGVIEYESTNSSDERLMCKDLKHFENAIVKYGGSSLNEIPKWWLLISTLPNQPVIRWPFWDYSQDQRTPWPKNKQKRDKNPFSYFARSVHECMSQTCSWIAGHFGGRMPTDIIWANIDGHALTVLNINGKRQKGNTSFRLRLKQKTN